MDTSTPEPGPNTSTETPSVTSAAPEQAHTGTLNFRIAETVEDVQGAWGLVYKAYRRRELIDPNPFRLHTTDEAIGSHAAVVLGQLDELTVTTLTVIGDSDKGLPLDRVYRDVLDEARASGRRLMEVGLFADRRDKLARSVEALFQLMRYTFYYGIHYKINDIVIGVHPRHARFYIRSFGFEHMGSPRTYPVVNDHPVVLLRGDIEANIKRDPPHPSLEYYQQYPVDREDFERRFSFTPNQLENTPLQEYLHGHTGQSAE